MMRFLPALLVTCCLLLAAGERPAGADARFPRPPALEPDVRFWTRVYTEVDTNGGFIHDSRSLGVVYEVLRFPEGLSRRARERRVDRTRSKYKKILATLSKGKRSKLSPDEQRVLALWPEGVSNSTLKAARKRIRFQLGQADKFRAGIIRSGAWEPHIRQTLQELGVPEELAALPHVESSYTPHAYSRVGAAGLWQFTRSTGRRYLRVDHVIDERLDPYRATEAAARLLKHNFRTTGTWPLAITSYNHGAGGMRRATRKLGTRDIDTIVRRYRSRTFGFASRNFYVEFLAALTIESDFEKYFGPLHKDRPIDYETVSLPYYAPANALLAALGVEQEVLARHNAALRPSVWRGSKRIPRGYEMRVPRSHLARPIRDLVAGIPASQRFAKQTRDSYHRVQRGETLSAIAARYGLRMSELQALNGLRSRNRIYAGQKLRLPDPGGSTRVASRAAAQAAPAAPPADGVYTVRRGDTLSRIGTRFGVSERELMNLNGLKNRNRIAVGQRLRVSAAPQGALAAADAEPHPQAVAALSPPSGEPSPASEASVVSTAAEEAETVASDEVKPPDDGGAPVLAATDQVGLIPTNEPSIELLADPSDYSVASNETVEVQPAETLGHFAEWLDVRASQLRRINRLAYRDPLPVGKRVRLDFGKVSPEAFEQARLAHHRDLQEAFFRRFEIEGTVEHVTRRGESLWVLSQNRYQVPLWLLRQYNPDLDFGSLHAGTRLTIPRLKPRDLQSDSASRTVASAPAG